MLRRGHIYYFDLGVDPNSHRQLGKRPCMVLSNNFCNKYSPTIHIIPLSKEKKFKFHVPIPRGLTKLKYDSYLLCEQATILDTHRLLDKTSYGVVPQDLIELAEKYVAMQLGLIDCTYESEEVTS